MRVHRWDATRAARLSAAARVDPASGRRFATEAGIAKARIAFEADDDRTRARRVAHTSGPRLPASSEKRADASAAMLPMPRPLIRRTLSGGSDRPGVARAARSRKVGVSALVEHLYTIGMIDAATRDGCRLHGAPA